MRLSWRDGSATLLVAAAAVLYALWAADALMPGVSTRWMTVITFALGVAACTANQRQLGEVYGATREGPRPSGLYIALATALGIVMLAAGILAFVLASEAILATLVAAMVALWLAATGLARADRPPSAVARPPCRVLRTAPRRADPVRRPQGRAVGFGQPAGRPGDGGCSDAGTGSGHLTNAGQVRQAVLITDMSGTTFCDSAGVHAIITAHRQITRPAPSFGW